MEAVILSAGQGKRLLPHTRTLPKCLLPIGPDGRTVLDLQIETLVAADVRGPITVMVGFGAEHVERHVREALRVACDVRLVFNPLHGHSDNLVTAWFATQQVDGDFVLLNGDTIFEPAVLHRALGVRDASVVAAVNRKDAYDGDDMCIWTEDTRIVGVGKERREREPDGEAIGLYTARGRGVDVLREAFARAVAGPDGLRSWYPPVLGRLTGDDRVAVADISGLWWTEIDVPEDLDKARVEVGSRFANVPGEARRAEPAGS
ncbi:MAG: NTP transferase domain-containing protein [Myxococcales bacterium]|nr:NTP transferase domain-containing protein [Myxococcales bacterium]